MTGQTEYFRQPVKALQAQEQMHRISKEQCNRCRMRCWQVAKPVWKRETQNPCASAKHTLETKEISEQAGD